VTTHSVLEHNLSELYAASGTPRMVEVPELTFLMIDGHGDPNSSPAYAEAIQTLFALSYKLKFLLRRLDGADHKVGPLEGLWWAPDMSLITDKSEWDWTMMVHQPDEVTPELVAQAASEVARAGSLPVHRVRLEAFAEGLAGQILHRGPYAEEGPTIARLHAYLAGQGYVFDGRLQKHHEIYLSDPRRAAPQRLRTIVRQPVRAW